MVKIYQQISIISLIILLLFIPTAHPQNITFAPAPNITQTQLFTFDNSTLDSAFISKQLQNLELTSTTINGSVVTVFTLSVFNRSASGNLTQYTLMLPGIWNFLKSSPQTLSCSLMLQTTTNTAGLFLFDSSRKQFRLLGAIPIAAFTNDTVPPQLIIQSVTLAERCSVAIFQTPQIYSIYRANPTYTQLNIVVLPSNWAVKAFSADMSFGISQNNLYRYNSNLFQYDLIYQFPSYQRYTIKNNGGRILVTAANSISLNSNNTGNSTNLTVYVFNYQSSNLSLITQFTITGAIESYYRIMVFSSPLLTRIGFAYQTTSGTTNIIAKYIDYTAKTATDLTFQDPVRYLNTVRNINANTELDFNEFFLVVRNGSAYNPAIPSVLPYEEGYQFIGTQLVFIRGRLLTGSPGDRELNSFVKTFIDSSNTNQLVVLNMYATSATQYDVYQYLYGNLASVQQIQLPVSPPYISFLQPDYTNVYTLPNSFIWAYFNSINSGSNTNISVVQFNSNSAGHIDNINFQVTGQMTLVYQNQQCKITKTAGVYTVYKYNATALTFTQIADITAVLTNITITANTVWSISNYCDRLQVGQNLFYKTNSSYAPVNNSPNLLSAMVSIDWNLTTLLTQSGGIWTYSNTINGYTLFFNSSAAFPMGSKIRTAPNIILIWGSNPTTAWALGFAISSTGQLTNCLNYTFNNFANTPMIQISQNLSKILVMGPAFPPIVTPPNNNGTNGTNGTNATNNANNGANITNNGTAQTRVDMFFVDYFGSQSSQSISFPMNAVKNPQTTYVSIGDSFIYVRQLNDPNNTNQPPLQELVFFLSQNTIPIVALTNNLTSSNTIAWQKTLVVSFNSSNYLMTENLVGSTPPLTRTVTLQEINSQQAALNNNPNQLYTAQVVSGKVQLCPPGCSSCTCTSCLSGYAYDSSTSTCRPCIPGCFSCTSQSLSTCSVCVPGTFLNSSSQCQPCASSCITCNVTATQCGTCPAGQFFLSTQCQPCSRNCFNCSSATVCITCQQGFTLTPTNRCRGCSLSCSSCSATNITECTACAPGLQLLNGACIACPANCLSCSSGTCGVCASGYSPNTNGVCVLSCRLPCVTCADNLPTFCTSCQSGSNLNAATGQCSLDLSCNANATCTNCGQGMGYFLMVSGSGAICSNCPQLSNCLQCDTVNTYKCAICSSGYYIDSNGACNPCVSNCTACLSASTCTGCSSGYTLMSGYSQGQCMQCQSPCATCQGSATYCTSCVAGYTKQKWKCQNNIFVGVKFTLGSVSPTTVLNDIDTIIAALLALLNEASTNVQAITILSITTGSTVVDSSYTPTNGASVTSSQSTLNAGLANGIPGYTVTSVSTTVYGVDSSSQSTNVGLIAGLVVGLTVLVVIVVVVIFFLRKKFISIQTQNEFAKANSGTSQQPNEIQIFQKQIGDVRAPSNQASRAQIFQ